MSQAEMPHLDARSSSRLYEIATSQMTSPSISRKTTEALISLGLIEEVGGRQAKSGRWLWRGECALTDSGRAYIAARRAAGSWF